MDTAKIFKTGRSQAVRLPKEYRFDADEVYIKRVGRTVMLLPKQASWQSVIDALAYFEPDFQIEREQPTQQRRPGLDTLFVEES